QKLYIDFRAPRFEAGRKIDNARLVRVVLNGQLIHDDVDIPQGLNDQEVATGPIMLQGDETGGVAFRNFRLPEPPAFFNGTDFNGWEGEINQHWKWDSAQEALVGRSATKGVTNTYLYSKQEYADFELSFQVMLSAGGNSGVGIRSTMVERGGRLL